MPAPSISANQKRARYQVTDEEEASELYERRHQKVMFGTLSESLTFEYLFTVFPDIDSNVLNSGRFRR